MSTYWIRAAIWLALAAGMAVKGPELVWLMFLAVACYFVARAILVQRKHRSRSGGTKSE